MRAKLAIVIVFLLGGWVSLFGQAPEAFNYQVVARDLSGNLLPNQQISFRMTIYKDEVFGIPVYQETLEGMTNPFGVISIQIGRGIPLIGNLSEVEWGNGHYFLGTEVDPTGAGTNYQTMGCTEMVSVPYALFAGNTLSSGYWKKAQGTENIYYNRGNVGIGTTNPDQRLTIMGRITLDTIVPYILFKEGGLPSAVITHIPPQQTGYLHLQAWDPTNNFEMTGLVVKSPGQDVGIGTINPMYKLDVAGTVKVNGLVMPGGAINGFVLTTDDLGNASWQAVPPSGISGSGSTDLIPKFTGTTSIGSSSIIQIDSNKVGLVVSTPKASLHIHTNTALNRWNKGLKLTNTQTGDGYGDGLELGFRSRNEDTDAILWNREEGYLAFGTDDDERVRITSDGKIGIGHTDPTAQLFIRQANVAYLPIVRIDNRYLDETYVYINWLGKIGIGVTDPDARFQIRYLGTNDPLFIAEDQPSYDETPFIITDHGDVGIGIRQPDARLYVSARSTITNLFRVDDDPPDDESPFLIDGNGRVAIGDEIPLARLFIEPQGDEHAFCVKDVFTIKPPGHVGIGNTTPSCPLDVTGNTKIAGSFSLTGNMTSTGTITANGTGTNKFTGKVECNGGLDVDGNITAKSDMSINGNGHTITIISGTSKIIIKPSGDITIESGNDIELKAQAGDIKLNARNIYLTAAEQLKTQSGTLTDIFANTTLDLRSTVRTLVSGSMVWLNGGGRPVSGIGDMVNCPFGGGLAPIISGSPTVFIDQ